MVAKARKLQSPPNGPMAEVLSRRTTVRSQFLFREETLTTQDGYSDLLSFSVWRNQAQLRVHEINSQEQLGELWRLFEFLDTLPFYDLALSSKEVSFVRMHKRVKAAGCKSPLVIVEFYPNVDANDLRTQAEPLRVYERDQYLDVYCGESRVATAFFYRDMKISTVKVAANCDAMLIAWAMLVWLKENSPPPFYQNVFSVFYFLNYFIYGLTFVWPRAMEFGLKNNAAIRSGQLWRLFTPMVLHESWNHVLLNNISILELGKSLETWHGVNEMKVLYIWSGFIGNVFSYSFEPFDMLGASTAVYGLYAAYFVFTVRHRYILRLSNPLKGVPYVVIALSIAWELFLHCSPWTSISRFGHLGGFVGGLLYSLLAGPRLFAGEIKFGEVMLENRPLGADLIRIFKHTSKLE